MAGHSPYGDLTLQMSFWMPMERDIPAQAQLYESKNLILVDCSYISLCIGLITFDYLCIGLTILELVKDVKQSRICGCQPHPPQDLLS